MSFTDYVFNLKSLYQALFTIATESIASKAGMILIDLHIGRPR